MPFKRGVSEGFRIKQYRDKEKRKDAAGKEAEKHRDPVLKDKEKANLTIPRQLSSIKRFMYITCTMGMA